MRKYAFIALILLIASFIGGCGSSDGAGSTLVASSNDLVKAADIGSNISGKTLYSVSSTTTVTSYTFGAGTTTGTITKNGVLDGTWTYIETTGEITITPVLGSIMKLKRIQVEAKGTSSEYWLMYDSNASNKIYRFYINQADAEAYLTSITTPFGFTYPKVLMGGTVQGQPLSFTGAADTRTVTTLAGSNANTPGTHEDTVTVGSERFNHPTGITTDGTSLYVADTANHVIRKILANGTTTTIAGTPKEAGSADTTPTSTKTTFSSPQGITFDGTYLYVADTGSAVIRRIDMSTTPATVTTIAGLANTLGAVDSTTSGADARFYSPFGITTDGTNLYVTDTSYHTIRKIKIAKTAAGSQYSQAVTTLAGSPGSAGSVDGTGTAARFNVPNRITTDGTNLYVTDFNNHTIRKVAIATGETTTIAGSSGVGASSSDSKVGTSARFYYPSGIITDGTNLFVTEFNDTNSSSPNYNNLIRQIILVDKNEVITIAGGSKTDLKSVDSVDGPARFSKPIDLTSNGTNLFVSNYSNGYTDPVTNIVYPDYNNIRKVGP